MATQAFLQQAYLAYFGRPADVSGSIAYANKSNAEVLNAFSASPESVALYGTGFGPAQVNAIYQVLFGRPAEAAGLTYWTAEVAAGRLTPAAAALGILTGAQNADAVSVSNKIVASAAFTAALDTNPEILGYSGDAAAASARTFLGTVTATAATQAQVDAAVVAAVAVGGVTGQTFALTTGADNFAGTAANDIVNVINVNASGGLATTAQSFDKVDGGAGTDTLNWYATTAENTAIAGTFSSMEVVNFFGAEKINVVTGGTGANATYTANIDATKIGGSQQIWVQSAAAVALGTTGTATNVSGGIVVTGLSGKTLGVAGKTAAGSATVDVTGDFGTGTAAALALSNASDAAGTGNAKVTFVGASLTSAAISGNGQAAITSGASIKALTINATGAATLDITGLAALTSIDGSASTGNTTLVGIATTAAAIKTGAGNDTFTVTATTKATVDSGAGNDIVTLGSTLFTGSTVNLGAGNDKLLGVAAQAPGATVVIDGGDGIDTVSGALINAGNGAAFKNFEAIDFAGMAAGSSLDAALLTGSTIQKLSVSGALASVGTATIQNVALTAGLEFTGANAGNVVAVVATGASTGTADAYTVTLANSAVITAAPTIANFAAGKVSLAGIETVNIVSGGVNSWNSLTVGNAAADFNATQKIVVTGASNLDLTIGSVQTLVGAATSVALTSVDASAATGKVSITTANNDIVKGAISLLGGSAADTFVIKTAVAANVNGTVYTVTTGGGADTVDVSGAAYGAGSASTANITTVTDFVAGDKLVFSGSTSFGGVGQAKANVSAATTLDAAFNIAAAGITGDNIAWFQYAGNTYVVEDNTTAAGGVGGADIAVKLAGVIDLSTATFAANSITL